MQKMDELLRKYWEGKSTLKEEKWLKEHVNWDDVKNQETEFFRYLKDQSEGKIPDEDFDKNILQHISKSNNNSSNINFLRVAAAIIILIAAGIVLNELEFKGQKSDQAGTGIVIADTYDDPEKAFEETKKALMFLSGKLNEGGAYAMELKKFNESQELLKKE